MTKWKMQNKSFSGLDRMRPITLFGFFYGQTFLHKGAQKKRFKLVFPANAAGNQHWDSSATFWGEVVWGRYNLTRTILVYWSCLSHICHLKNLFAFPLSFQHLWVQPSCMTPSIRNQHLAVSDIALDTHVTYALCDTMCESFWSNIHCLFVGATLTVSDLTP